MKTIVVSGAIANRYPYGGATWGRLEWVLGFKALGCKVYFLEQIAAENCVDQAGQPVGFEQSENRAFFDTAMDQFGLADSAVLFSSDGARFHGLGKNDLFDVASGADLLVNISGHLNFESLFARFRRKAYVDVDPGYTQFWHTSGNPNARLAGHDYYFTIGQNIGTPGCTIPTCGIAWRRTWPPVTLEYWPPRMRSALDRFTTIASWRGAYGTSELGGKRFGPKAHAFRNFFELPERVPAQFELALDIHSAEQSDLAALQKYGWRLVDPKVTAGDPRSFQAYVQNSAAEFSVAQPVYTETGSGWFSQRTAEYLASGKPVLVQDTGLARHLPIGDGLVTFTDLEQAIDGVEKIRANYAQHCRAARALAEEHFDSNKVLANFLAEIPDI